MSLAAIPVYLLMRRLGGGSWAALAAAALTVASPDLFFSSFVLADAIAYPLVLGAVYLGVCALSTAEPRLPARLRRAGGARDLHEDPVRLPAARLRRGGSRGRARLGARGLAALPALGAPVLGAAGVRCRTRAAAAARLLLRRRRPARAAGRDRPLARHRLDAARLRGGLRARPRRARRDRVRALAAALARGERLAALPVGLAARALRRGGDLRDQRHRPFPGALPDDPAAARVSCVLALAPPRPAGSACGRVLALGLLVLSCACRCRRTRSATSSRTRRSCSGSSGSRRRLGSETARWSWRSSPLPWRALPRRPLSARASPTSLWPQRSSSPARSRSRRSRSTTASSRRCARPTFRPTPAGSTTRTRPCRP